MSHGAATRDRALLAQQRGWGEVVHPFRRAQRIIRKVATHESAVLLTGETGTGKEVAAREIHAASRRAGGPFVPVDCPSLSETLAESQLFGHVAGAFTGAAQPAEGFFRAAEGGTLFLDEVGELPLALQPKLLRCLQERSVVPVGAARAVPVDVRIVTATHSDLPAMVARGQFREDLYFRLNVVGVRLPPLRERLDEIGEIAEALIGRTAELNDAPVKSLAPDARDALRRYRWPGNIRELANAIEHAFVMAEGPAIRAADLPVSVRLASPEIQRAWGGLAVLTLAEAERRTVLQAMRSASGNKSKAASLLGTSRQGLYRLLQRHGLGGAAGARA